MYNLKQFFAVLDGVAPLKFSTMQIERGDYDNSGIIVDAGKDVKRVLFTLDLSFNAIKRAAALKCDTIVTHHPAIYRPIKSIDYSGETKALYFAVNKGFNVISMHLNLDVAKGGIDESLSIALGSKNAKILDLLEDEVGYGREFAVNKPREQFVKELKDTLNTKKVLVYGSEKTVKVAASFCGGGSGHAICAVLENKTVADTIITSDIPHHALKTLTEEGKTVIILTHYSAENYGFNKFYEKIKDKTCDNIETFYFTDRRFL